MTEQVRFVGAVTFTMLQRWKQSVPDSAEVRRISEAEYERRLHGIYERSAADLASGLPEDEVVRRTKDGELDALVDFRLGVDFSRERREKLRRAQAEIALDRQRADERRSGGAMTIEAAEREMGELSTKVLDRLSAVLTPEELHAFMGDGTVAPGGP